MELTANQMNFERDRRIAMLNELIREFDLDALLLMSTSQQSCQMAVKFTSGYQLNTRRAFILMKKGELPYLALPTIGQKFHAQSISWLPAENILAGDIMKYALEMISSIGKSKPRIGLYESNEIPISIWNKITETGAEFFDVTERFTELRRDKSEVEILLTREASRIAAESFELMVKLLAPSKTEQELIGAAEGFLRANGAWDSLVLTRSQRPHTFISRAMPVPIEKDGVFVYSAEVAGPYGYWTQLVRPVFMSHDAHPEAYRILQVIKEAEAAGVEKFVPGNKICDVAIAIDKVVAEAGLKNGVWSGHGMGADLGDGVGIGADNDMLIVPNTILTLHPSVMSDTDGMLYGNTWISTETGPVNLTPQYTETCFLDELKELIGTTV